MRNRALVILIAVLFTAGVVVYLVSGNAGGTQGSTPGENPETVSSSILINEVMASNPSVIPNAEGEFYDWIELRNLGEEAVSLAGWGLSDDSSISAKWVFPEGTVIEGGGYLLVYCSDENRADPGGELHTNFKLKSGSDTAVLSNTSGRVADALTLPNVTSGHSIARNAADITEWEDCTEPTPGFSNDEAGRQAYLASMDASSVGLLINEFQPQNKTTLSDASGAYPDWVEIYNPTSQTVDMSGFGLSDSRDKPMEWVFPQGTALAPGEYLLVFCDKTEDVTNQYPDELHAGFALSS